MQAPFDNIVQHLFHQPSLHSVTVDELENMAAQHPYFAAAHFLLLKKMQDLQHPHFNTQLHKTTLYFNNPLWLQFLLQPKTVANFRVLDEAPFISNETALPVELPPPHTSGQEIVNEDADQTVEINSAQVIRHPEEALSPVPHTGIMEIIKAVFDEDARQEPPSVFENTAAISTDTPIADEWLPSVDESTVSPASTDGPVLMEDNYPDPEEITAVPEKEDPAPATTEVIAVSAVTENQQSSPSPTVEHHEEHVSPSGEPPGQPLIIEAMPELKIVAENSDQLPAPQVQADDLNEPDNTAAIPEAAAAKDDKPLFKTVIETAGAKNDFLFEPYHTVDYFASQGIKLSRMEAESKDKLGRQLKSFTEWLKSMKKLPQVSIDKILSENEESKVVADAIHSIASKEVITEAMAEVFEKQGMADKAIDTYQKLSLQNPAKSAYFAAKIDVLKH